MRSRARIPRPEALVPVLLLAAALALPGCRGRSAAPGAAAPARDYPLRPVPFTDVVLTDAFWAPRLETNRTVTIPYALRMIEETGRVDNFRKAAQLLSGPILGRALRRLATSSRSWKGPPTRSRLRPDPALEKTLDDLIALIARPRSRTATSTRRGPSTRPIRPGAGPERWSLCGSATSSTTSATCTKRPWPISRPRASARFLDVALKNAALLLARIRPRPAPRLPRTPGDRDRAGQALSAHRRPPLPRPGQVLPRPARPRLPGDDMPPTIPSPIYDPRVHAGPPARPRAGPRPSATPCGPSTCTRAWPTWPPWAAIPITCRPSTRLWQNVVGTKAVPHRRHRRPQRRRRPSAPITTCPTPRPTPRPAPRSATPCGTSACSCCMATPGTSTFWSGSSTTGCSPACPSPAIASSTRTRWNRPGKYARSPWFDVRLLPAEHRPLPALAPGLRLRHPRRHRLRQPVHRRPRPGHAPGRPSS